MNNQLESLARELVFANEINKALSKNGVAEIFQNPLIGIAGGDDRLFVRFKEAVGPLHLTPSEMWRGTGYTEPAGEAGALRVVSFAFPFSSQIRAAYSEGDEFPSELYALGRHFSDSLISDVMTSIMNHIRRLGYEAMEPARSPLLKIHNGRDIEHVYATWSERHIAFAAGLGTFSLHEGLITRAGCNVRLGSLITDMPLEITPRETENPFGNCLYFRDGSCRKCVQRCPAGAITEQGHDKNRCYMQRNKAREEMKKKLIRYRNIPYRINFEDLRAGCALCQFDVPCTDRVPDKIRGK